VNLKHSVIINQKFAASVLFFTFTAPSADWQSLQIDDEYTKDKRNKQVSKTKNQNNWSCIILKKMA